MKMKLSSENCKFIVLLCILATCNVICQPPPSATNTACGSRLTQNVIVCETGILVLQCEPDKHIKIVTADYGRTELGSVICPHPKIKSVDCKSFNSTQVAAGICDEKQCCHLGATNEVFGEPCEETSKYLQVKFCCK